MNCFGVRGVGLRDCSGVGGFVRTDFGVWRSDFGVWQVEVVEMMYTCSMDVSGWGE